MLKALGEFGGVVRKPLRTGEGFLPVGHEITAEQAKRWPKANRLAMDRQNQVFWYPAAPSLPQQPTGASSREAQADSPDPTGLSKPLSYGAPAAEGEPVPEAPPDQSPPAPADPAGQQDAAAPADSSQPPPDPPRTAPTTFPPIDPDTAEKSDLRKWLIALGDEPPPALGEEKLRQRVRDKLAGINPPKEGD